MQTLSVLIVNWNGAMLLPACLESIERYGKGVPLEIIVFDNGSTDGSIEIIDGWMKRLPVRILRSPTNIGYASANNRAWEASKSEFCLLLNNDAIIGGALEGAVEYLTSDPTVAACQGPVLSSDGSRIDSVGSLISRSGFLVHPHIGDMAEPAVSARSVFSVKGAAMYVRSTAVRQIGLFDETAFAYFEESDFCWRARLSGWDVRYSDRLPPVYHMGGATSTRLSPSVYEYHSYKNRLRSILKNASWPTLASMLPLHIAVCGLGAAGGVAAGRPGAAVNVARAYLWNLMALRDTFVSRKRVQAGRTRSDNDVFSGVKAPLGLRQLLQMGRFYERGKKRPRAADVSAS